MSPRIATKKKCVSESKRVHGLFFFTFYRVDEKRMFRLDFFDSFQEMFLKM